MDENTELVLRGKIVAIGLLLLLAAGFLAEGRLFWVSGAVCFIGLTLAVGGAKK